MESVVIEYFQALPWSCFFDRFSFAMLSVSSATFIIDWLGLGRALRFGVLVLMGIWGGGQ